MIAVLQFEAVSLPVLDRMMDEGRLPTLAGLRRDGEWLEVDGPSGYLEGASFATVHTGLRPTQHGFYYPWQWSAADQRLRTRFDIPVPDAIWDRLGRAGRRALVIDPYDCAPARAVDGVAVCGWQATNRVALAPWSSPPRARRQLSARHGKPRSADEIFGAARVSELMRLREVVLDAPRRVAAAALHFLARERFDLVWVELVGPHLAGHQFWDVGRVLDLTRASADERRAIDTTLGDVYEAADRALGEIIAALPEGADVIVMAASGMGPERDRSDLLPGMLRAVLEGGQGASADGRGGSLLWSLRAKVPPSLRAQVARLVPDRAALELAARLLTAGTDWSRTRAFAVPNDPCGAVRLNLAGRERRGVVDPGEAEDLMREIAAGLMSFREPDDAPAVTAVERSADVEPEGPYSHLLPELLVHWPARTSNGLRAVESPEFGEVRRPGRGSGRSGNHTQDAWALVAPAGSRVRRLDRPPHLVDVAATVYAHLGLDPELSRAVGEPLLESA